MKNIYALLVCLVLLSACGKDDHPLVVTPKATLLQYISGDAQLTLFKAALQKAGMLNDSALSGNGPYTIFAPVDSAMQIAGLTTDKISSYDPKVLAGILQYHILFGRLGSANIVGFYSAAAVTQNPNYRPVLTKNYYGIFLDGKPVTQGNIIAGDGIIHKLCRVAFPPVGTIRDVLAQAPDLTMYSEVLRLLGTYDYMGLPDPVAPIKVAYQNLTDSTITALAPTDDAFHAYGFQSVSDLQNADPVLLHKLFDAYFQLGTNYTSQLKGGAVWSGRWYNFSGASYPGTYIRIQLDGLSIQGSGNITPVHISRPDVVATNGIVQVLDQILVP